MPVLTNGNSLARGIRALALIVGAFFIFMGISKIDWLKDSGLLLWQLQRWHESASAVSRWYLETIAIPGAPLFARFVPFGELAAGAALVCGFRVRLFAALALFMILNFHFASGIIFSYGYLTNGYGLPVVGGLVALAIGGGRLPLSLSK